MRKKKNARNRAYQAIVLRGRKQQPKGFIEDMIEDGLLQAQVVEDCLVHHTATYFESAG